MRDLLAERLVFGPWKRLRRGLSAWQAVGSLELAELRPLTVPQLLLHEAPLLVLIPHVEQIPFVESCRGRLVGTGSLSSL